MSAFTVTSNAPHDAMHSSSGSSAKFSSSPILSPLVRIDTVVATRLRSASRRIRGDDVEPICEVLSNGSAKRMER